MKKRILLILLISVLLLGMLATAFSSCKKTEDPGTEPEGPVTLPGITPDYPAPPVEEGAEDAVDGDGKLEVPEGTTGAGIEYTTEVSIDISDKKVGLYFRNPSRSLQNIALELVIQGQVIAESGLLTPGKRITMLDLKDGVNVSAGVYAQDAKLVVRFFDPETNTCSIVSSEILVTVTAVE